MPCPRTRAENERQCTIGSLEDACMSSPIDRTRAPIDDRQLATLDDRLDLSQRQLGRTVHHVTARIERAPVAGASNQLLRRIPAEGTTFVRAHGDECANGAACVDNNDRFVTVSCPIRRTGL